MVSFVTADTITDLRPVIENAAKDKDLDPVLMEAIIRHESAHGKSKLAKNKNNLAGIMGRKGPKRYETAEDSIHDLASILRKYKESGRCSIKQIGRRYCATNSQHWSSSVHKIMNKITDGSYD